MAVNDICFQFTKKLIFTEIFTSQPFFKYLTAPVSGIIYRFFKRFYFEIQTEVKKKLKIKKNQMNSLLLTSKIRFVFLIIR